MLDYIQSVTHQWLQMLQHAAPVGPRADVLDLP